MNLAFEATDDARFNPAAGNWADLAKEILQSAASIAFISSEGFESAAPARIKAAIDQHFQGHEVEILSYLRPHMDRLRASYSQNTKTGKYTKDFETFAQKSAKGRLGTPSKRLLTWRKTFGDAFQLRLYDRATLRDGDILRDVFQDAMGLSDAAIATMPHPDLENKTPGAATVEVIRQWCDALPFEDLPCAAMEKQLRNNLERAVLYDLREDLMAIYPDDPPIQYSAELAHTIYKELLDDARAIDAAFFADHPRLERALEASRDKALAAPKPFDMPEHDKAIHAAYAKAMAQLVRRLAALAQRPKF